MSHIASVTSGWDGTFLGEWTATLTGEMLHDHRAIVIQHWLAPITVRPLGKPGGWTTFEPGVRVRLPGDAEHTEWRESPRFRFLWVTPERVERVLGARWDRSGLTRWRDPRYPLPFVEHVLGAMMEDVEAGYPAGPITGNALLVALLHHLDGGPLPAPAAPSDLPGDRRIDLVLEYIDANLARPLRVVELASLAGFGVRRFGAVFAAETGWSPHQYVLHRRIERAKRLMRDPDLTLAQIAQAVGFSRSAQFSRVFRSLAGEAPRVYRRR